MNDFSIDPLDNTLSDVHSALNMSFYSEPSIHHQTSQENIGTESIENLEHIETNQTENYRLRWKDNIGSTFKGSFSEQNINQLLDKLNSYNEGNTNQTDIDELTNDLVNIYIKTAQSVGLCKNIKDHNPNQKKSYTRRYSQKDWFDDDCENKRKEYMKLKNKGHYIKGRQEKKKHSKLLSAKHKEYKKFLSKKENRFRITIEEKLRNSKNSDPKSYWKILGNDAKPVKENNISLNCFKEHFQKLNQVYREVQADFNPTQILEPNQNDSGNSDLQELNRDYTTADIEKLIKKLKNGKSPGSDNIIGEYLKNSPEILIETIVNLFNLVLKTGVVPSNWCVGIIIPLFKNKGSVNNVDNYRGITLLSVIGKLFTSSLNERLSKFVDNTSARGEEQVGFRAGYSTLYHIFVLHTLIGFYLNNKRRLYCCFIDYSKAFDLIDRVTLWRKLIDTGIKGNVLRVIYNLYIKAKSCVKKGKNISDFFNCNVGVRQGDNLSPLLFAMYINDFESYVKNKYDGLPFLNVEIDRLIGDNELDMYLRLYILLYADDTIILAESVNQLQLALNAVKSYCDANFLKINLTKTKVIIFSRGKIRNLPEFFYGTEKVEIVDDYIYLGVTINYNGSFTKAIEKQIGQARKAMFSMITKARRLQLPVDIQLELFEKTVVPVLLYGCEVWGCGNTSDLEVFYRSFLKITLKLGKATPNCMVYGETGTCQLQKKIFKRMLLFWFKVSEDKNSKIATKMYKIMFKLHNNSYYSFPWAKKIVDILDSCGHSYLWVQQEQYESKMLHFHSITQTIDDCILSTWNEKVQSGSRCKNYRIFKETLELEFYLTNLKPILRIAMSKFRCANNKLPSNDYRYIGNDAEKICKLCNIKEVGDEFHYLFICTHFKNERKTYLKKYYIVKPNTFKMNKLFNTKNKKTLVMLARFQVAILSYFN